MVGEERHMQSGKNYEPEEGKGAGIWMEEREEHGERSWQLLQQVPEKGNPQLKAPVLHTPHFRPNLTENGTIQAPKCPQTADGDTGTG